MGRVVHLEAREDVARPRQGRVAARVGALHAPLEVHADFRRRQGLGARDRVDDGGEIVPAQDAVDPAGMAGHLSVASGRLEPRVASDGYAGLRPPRLEPRVASDGYAGLRPPRLEPRVASDGYAGLRPPRLEPRVASDGYAGHRAHHSPLAPPPPKLPPPPEDPP